MVRRVVLLGGFDMQSTKERLLAAVARYAKGRSRLSAREFCREAGVSHQTLHAKFGGFVKLLKVAGLSGASHKRMGIGEGELMEEFHRLAEEHGRYPMIPDFGREGGISWSVFTRRFGRMRSVRERYDRWRAARGLRVLAAPGRKDRRESGEFPLGEPAGHRWVLHAPTTEAGVIHVFGVLAAELGYAVASIRGAFPDCLAYKASEMEPDRWKKVRIEFELKSSNFLRHGHDPKGCDLIVCWEDDWKGSPVEVLALKGRVGG